MVNNRTWIDDIKTLVINPILIPTNNMSIEEQINCLTRLIIAFFVILLLFTTSINSLIFLFISLGIIIFIYEYYKRMYHNNNTRENFTLKKSNYCKGNTTLQNNGKNDLKNKLSNLNISTERVSFCDEFVKMDPGPNFVSRNQKLAGKPHPRTYTQPIIVNQAYDLNSWRDDNTINFSQINKFTNEELYLSGVEPSTYCGDLDNAYLVPSSDYSRKYSQNISNNNIIEDVREDFCTGNNCRNSNQGPYGGPIQNPVETKETNTNTNTNTNINTNTQYGELIDAIKSLYHGSEKETQLNERYTEYPGSVNKQCGYNPNQVKNSNLPVNFPAGNCEQSKNVSNYNKNLFTQIVQPGVYYNSDVIEPINSNIGISFNQQIEPTTCEFTESGDMLYKAHDPYMVNVVKQNDRDSVINSVDNANIYDPRSDGYGTSYRAYTHDVTGQTRFMYDDINAIRMPNYICRSNIDFENYADSYGPMKANEEFGNNLNSNIRALAQDSWLRNSLQFRNDLTVARSRKQLSEAWQRRVAPIHTRNTKAIATFKGNK